jgi:serine protease Do
MKTTLGTLGALACLALLTACQSANNPFQDSYKNTLPSGSETLLLPHTGEPQLEAAPADIDAAVLKLENRGYLAIGSVNFVADAEDRKDSLLAQARAVQADLVLVLVEPVSVRTEVNKQAGFESGKDFSNQSSTPAGNSRTGGSYSRPSGYTTGSFANKEIVQNRYIAVFLRKRLLILGATVEPVAQPLPAGTSATFGMEVKTVIENSPAYFADLKPGDILTAVASQTFPTKEQYQLLVNAHAGGMTDITFVRRGVERTVSVKLNPLPKR